MRVCVKNTFIEVDEEEAHIERHRYRIQSCKARLTAPLVLPEESEEENETDAGEESASQSDGTRSGTASDSLVRPPQLEVAAESAQPCRLLWREHPREMHPKEADVDMSGEGDGESTSAGEDAEEDLFSSPSMAVRQMPSDSASSTSASWFYAPSLQSVHSPPPAAAPPAAPQVAAQPQFHTRHIVVEVPVEVPYNAFQNELGGFNLTMLSSNVRQDGATTMVEMRLAVDAPTPISPTIYKSPTFDSGVVSSMAYENGVVTTPSGQVAAEAGEQASLSQRKSTMVCCHWKNKGWCRYQAECKFQHPEHKRGVGNLKRTMIGPVRRRGGRVPAVQIQQPPFPFHGSAAGLQQQSTTGSSSASYARSQAIPIALSAIM